MFYNEILKLVSVMESYRGRDRLIRLLSYGAMFLGGDGKTPGQVKWKTISSEAAACRVILRLFDDLPMFLLNLSTGFGLKGTKPPLKPFELFTSVLNQLFYPVEHIAWLREKKIFRGHHLPILLLALIVWGLSLIGEILKSFMKLRLMASQAKNLVKQKQLDKDNGGSQNAQIKENLSKLNEEKKDVILTIVQTSCDLINAISWLPPGFLWSQKLSKGTNGFIGTIASVVMLYRNWPVKPVFY